MKLHYDGEVPVLSFEDQKIVSAKCQLWVLCESDTSDMVTPHVYVQTWPSLGSIEIISTGTQRCARSCETKKKLCIN